LTQSSPRWKDYKDLETKFGIAEKRYKAGRARVKACQIQEKEKKSGKPDQKGRELFLKEFGYAVPDPKVD
jgi:hypothetical protein